MPKKTVQQVVESGNYYVVQVKGNQPKLHQLIQSYSENQKPVDTYTQSEKKRGKITTWTTNVYDVISNEITQKWSHLNCFIITHKEVVYKHKTVNTIAYRITNIDDLPASIFYKGIRGHWGIENRIHWVRDVIFGQDGNELLNDNAATNMAFFNTIALNFLRKNYNDSIKYAQILFGQNVKELFKQFRI